MVMPAGAPMEDGRADALLAGCVGQLIKRYGESLDAIILYGSYLRGAADAMPDLYVLLRWYPPAPWLGNLLPPNVYHLAADGGRAKVSTLRTRQLQRAVALDLHPYFWARFAQPRGPNPVLAATQRCGANCGPSLPTAPSGC